MEAEPASPQEVVKPRTRTGAVLLAVYTALAGWILYEQSTSWPHEGSWAYFALLFLLPGMVFQTFSLAWTLRTGRPVRRGMLVRLVTIPLGLIAAVTLARLASDLAMRGFEKAHAPFVSQLGASLADPCAAPARYFSIPSVAAYNARAGQERPSARLHHGANRYVLAFRGGSVDIDGSTIYFESGGKAWRKFHNDDAAASGDYARLIEGLAECPLKGPGA